MDEDDDDDDDEAVKRWRGGKSREGMEGSGFGQVQEQEWQDPSRFQDFTHSPSSTTTSTIVSMVVPVSSEGESFLRICLFTTPNSRPPNSLMAAPSPFSVDSWRDRGTSFVLFLPLQ